MDGKLHPGISYKNILYSHFSILLCRTERQDGSREPKHGFEFWFSAGSELERPAQDHPGVGFSTTAAFKMHGRTCPLISC